MTDLSFLSAGFRHGLLFRRLRLLKIGFIVLSVLPTFIVWAGSDLKNEICSHAPYFLPPGHPAVRILEREVIMGKIKEAWSMDRTPDAVTVKALLEDLLHRASKEPNLLSIYDMKMVKYALKSMDNLLPPPLNAETGIVTEGGPHVAVAPDKSLSFRIDPVFRAAWFPNGYIDGKSLKDGSFYSVGLETAGRFGDKVGFQAFATDSREWNYDLGGSGSFQPRETVPRVWNENDGRGSVDYDRADGAITFRNGKVSLMVGKTPIVRGYSEENFITRGQHAPDFPLIGYTWDSLSWIRFSWYTGFLESGVYDTLSQSTAKWPKVVPVDKEITWHRIDLKLFPWMEFSVGESVIYAHRSFEGIYWIPVMFYWSAEHYLGDLDNVQIFLDGALNPIEGLRVYGSLYVDEFSIEKCLDASDNHNWIAWQGGMVFTSDKCYFPPFVRVEYTRVTPGAYQHRWPESEYTNSGVPLGFWGGRNSDNLEIETRFDFPCGFSTELFASVFRKGIEFPPDSLYGEGLTSRKLFDGGHSTRKEFGLKLDFMSVSGAGFSLKTGRVFWIDPAVALSETADFSKYYFRAEVIYRYR